MNDLHCRELATRSKVPSHIYLFASSYVNLYTDVHPGACLVIYCKREGSTHFRSTLFLVNTCSAVVITPQSL